MTEPWETPPPPTSGDADATATYAGVGRVMSRWEEIEIELAHFYSMLIDAPHEAVAIRAYGEGRIFRDRFAILQSEAQKHFISAPNQVHEGAFCCLRLRTSAFADRRNDVAHGVVRQMQWIPTLKAGMPVAPISRMQFCLVPPHYMRRKFDPDNAPAYAYTSSSMLLLEEGLYWHAIKIKELCALLFPENESS